jgi:hypothetical protein
MTVLRKLGPQLQALREGPAAPRDDASEMAGREDFDPSVAGEEDPGDSLEMVDTRVRETPQVHQPPKKPLP